jgi:hypothetical protein
MSQGSNLSGLAPLGSKKMPPAVTVIPESSAFDLIPDKSDRKQEFLSPLAMRNNPMKISSLNSPTPALKVSFQGRNPNPKGNGNGLAPLNANRNINNDSSNDNDPLKKPLQRKKLNLAPMGLDQMSMLPAPTDIYNSPIKRRIGANRIISPMGDKQNDIPMQLLGVSRTNLSYTMRRAGPPGASPVSKGKQLLNLDGAFPTDDVEKSDGDGDGGVDLHHTIRQTHRLRESGSRIKGLIGGDGPSPFASGTGIGAGIGGGDPMQMQQSLRKSLRRRQEPNFDPWSTTSGSASIY